MRWVTLLLATMVLGACAVPIGSSASLGSAPSRDPAPADRPDPTPIEPTTAPGFRADLPDLGEAPELQNTVWLNTDRPLRLTDLQGKVVLLDMWTFG